MRRSISRFLVGLFAAPLMLASSSALADPNAAACANAQLIADGKCDFVVDSGGCETMCTPLSFVAACDGECNVSADVSCTGGCEASCMGSCTPGSIDCEGSCTTSCSASCMSSCPDTGCQSDCDADCSNRCKIACDVKPPSCDESCKVACDASCTVQANIDCHYGCTANIEGGCTTQCQTPKGALFCDGQYVNAGTTADDCLTYLENQGFNVQITTTCDATGCAIAATTCSAGPAIGSARDGLGIGAIAGMMMGLGLVVSRRRRRPS
jgi:hypothetical protein